METTDRVRQVNWLNELAANIAANCGSGTAEELVEFALGEGAETWGVVLPSWFDDHDRRLLVDLVRRALGKTGIPTA